MQPWRPRPQVFAEYERNWREERNLQVEAHKHRERLKQYRPPRRRGSSFKNDGMASPRKSENSTQKMDNDSLLDRARATLKDRRIHLRSQRADHEKSLISKMSAAPTNVVLSSSVGADKTKSKILPKKRLKMVISLAQQDIKKRQAGSPSLAGITEQLVAAKNLQQSSSPTFDKSVSFREDSSIPSLPSIDSSSRKKNERSSLLNMFHEFMIDPKQGEGSLASKNSISETQGNLSSISNDDQDIKCGDSNELIAVNTSISEVSDEGEYQSPFRGMLSPITPKSSSMRSPLSPLSAKSDGSHKAVSSVFAAFNRGLDENDPAKDIVKLGAESPVPIGSELDTPVMSPLNLRRKRSSILLARSQSMMSEEDTGAGSSRVPFTRSQSLLSNEGGKEVFQSPPSLFPSLGSPALSDFTPSPHASPLPAPAIGLPPSNQVGLNTIITDRSSFKEDAVHEGDIGVISSPIQRAPAFHRSVSLSVSSPNKRPGSGGSPSHVFHRSASFTAGPGSPLSKQDSALESIDNQISQLDLAEGEEGLRDITPAAAQWLFNLYSAKEEEEAVKAQKDEEDSNSVHSLNKIRQAKLRKLRKVIEDTKNVNTRNQILGNVPGKASSKAMKNWEEVGKVKAIVNERNRTESEIEAASLKSEEKEKAAKAPVANPLGAVELAAAVPRTLAEDRRQAAGLIAKMDQNGILDLSRQSRMRGTAVEPLMWSLFRVPNCTHLDLSYNCLLSSGADALKFLGFSTSVTALNLCSTHIRSAGCVSLANGLLGRPDGCALTSLNLARNGIGDEGATQVALAVSSTCPHLLRLDLSENRITSTAAFASLGAMLDAAPKFPPPPVAAMVKDEEGSHEGSLDHAEQAGIQLDTLSIQKEKLNADAKAQAARESLKIAAELRTRLAREAAEENDSGLFDGLNAIGKGVGVGPAALTYLDLSGNEAQAAGAAALSVGLHYNGTLTSLNLRSCSLGSTGCRALMKAARTARALAFLNVSLNGIGYGMLEPTTPKTPLPGHDNSSKHHPHHSHHGSDHHHSHHGSDHHSHHGSDHHSHHGSNHHPQDPALITMAVGSSSDRHSAEQKQPSHVNFNEPSKEDQGPRQNRSGSLEKGRRRKSRSSRGSRGSRGSMRGDQADKGRDSGVENVMIDTNEPLGIIDLHKGNLTILKLVPNGQAARAGLLPGMQIKAVAHFPVKNKDEFDELIRQLVDDAIGECPLSYKDNRKNKTAGLLDDEQGLEPVMPGPKLATSTTSYLHSMFDRCPHMERLNASNNAGIDGVFILKKPSFQVGDLVEVDWRGRGQYFKANILRVNAPIQSFDVKYVIDEVIDQRVLPYRIRGYIKQRADDPRPPAKY